MDSITKEQRYKAMHNNVQRDTSIELLLRKALWSRGVRYRKNVTSVLGKPDICIKKYKIAIFCDGDFWHGKNYNKEDFHINQEFWDNKIRNNMERDLEYTIRLRDMGWRVLRFWESDIRHNVWKCVDLVVDAINKKKAIQKKRVESIL